ncbi:MAG: hypothetical protein L0I76_24630 [Pseudonocardia sp.]|nr:hypothetical protein [Pseudonocardia sp.]
MTELDAAERENGLIRTARVRSPHPKDHIRDIRPGISLLNQQKRSITDIVDHRRRGDARAALKILLVAR